MASNSISARKVNTSVFRRRKYTEDISMTFPIAINVSTRDLLFGGWQKKFDVNVCKQISSLRLVFSKTNCNCNIWGTFLSAFVVLGKCFSFCGAVICQDTSSWQHAVNHTCVDEVIIIWTSSRSTCVFIVVIRPLSTRLIQPNFHVSLSHRRSTTLSLETKNLFTW